MAFFSRKTALEYASKSQKLGLAREGIEVVEAEPVSNVNPEIEPDAEGDGDGGLIYNKNSIMKFFD